MREHWNFLVMLGSESAFCLCSIGPFVNVVANSQNACKCASTTLYADLDWHGRFSISSGGNLVIPH